MNAIHFFSFFAALQWSKSLSVAQIGSEVTAEVDEMIQKTERLKVGGQVLEKRDSHLAK